MENADTFDWLYSEFLIDSEYRQKKPAIVLIDNMPTTQRIVI